MEISKKRMSTLILMLIIIAGDIELNPGPETTPVRTRNSFSILTPSKNQVIPTRNLKDFNKVRSTGDGHCLLYSTITSYNFQFPRYPPLDYHTLLHNLEDYTTRNAHLFSNFVGLDHQFFLKQMSNYIYTKAYDCDAVDILPTMLASMLNIKIGIFEGTLPRQVRNLDFIEITPIQGNSSQVNDVMYIVKTRDHYDGLSFKSGSRQSISNKIQGTPTPSSRSTKSLRSNVTRPSRATRSSTSMLSEETQIGCPSTFLNKKRSSNHDNNLRVAQPADNLDARMPARNQAGYEKHIQATGTKSPQPLSGSQAEDHPHTGLPKEHHRPEQTSKKVKEKWTKEDYIHIMKAYYLAILNPSTSNTKDTYKIWRNWFPHQRSYIDENKLANIRRFIIRTNKLSTLELNNAKEEMELFLSKEKVQREVSNADSRNEIHNERPKFTLPSPDEHKPTMLEFMEEIPLHKDPTDMSSINDANGSSDRCALNKSNPNEDEHLIYELKEEILHEWKNNCQMDVRVKLPKIHLTKFNRYLIWCSNKALSEIKSEIKLNFSQVNELFYATGKILSSRIVPKSMEFLQRPTIPSNHKREPIWKQRISNKIKVFRRDLSLLTEVAKEINQVNPKKKWNIFRKYEIANLQDNLKTMEILKQKIQLYAQRIRRYEKRTKQFVQNKLFQEDTKKFFRSLEKSETHVSTPPTLENVTSFWGGMYGTETNYNVQANWIKNIDEKIGKQIENRSQHWDHITEEEVSDALRNARNWSSPGIDKVPNFWLKQISALHKDLAGSFNEICENPSLCPSWALQGITYLHPKNSETADPKNYRPITCLSNMYKNLSWIIARRIRKHMELNNLLASEQKGCRRNCYGCKDHLLVNKMILENCKTTKRNLSVAWIDYQKAFDSVPHSWILKSLEIYRISPVISNFLKSTMAFWQTTLILHHNEGKIETPHMKIKKGIFQGDSLSPLLFCIALNPLSTLLNDTSFGYQLNGNKINHLLYMDDLKLFAKNENDLNGLIGMVKTFSDDIMMKFGFNKCARVTLKRGKLTSECTDASKNDSENSFKQLKNEDHYVYLGIDENENIHHSQMKEKIRKEYYKRVRKIFQSELNAKNKISAVNSLAVPVVSYGFNVINWTIQEIKSLDVKTRKLLTMNRMHHPKSDVDRLYLSRHQGGRGLLQLELCYKVATVGLHMYLECTNDPLMKLVLLHEKKKKLHSIHFEALKYMSEANVTESSPTSTLPGPIQRANLIKVQMKRKLQETLLDKWSAKALHGQYVKRLQHSDTNSNFTNKWLLSSGLKGETEGLIMAAQDQSLATNNYKKIMGLTSDNTCRLCKKQIETVDHIISGCEVLANNEYTHRHNNVARYIHWTMCKHFDITVGDKWYLHEPEIVTSKNNITILWDMAVHTDKEIKANRPDIIVKDFKNSTCLLIDISVPNDKNVSTKYFEKISKYKDLQIEVERMWKLKSKIIPVTVGALGLVIQNLEKSLADLPGSPSITEVQKIALLGTARILRKFLSM